MSENLVVWFVVAATAVLIGVLLWVLREFHRKPRPPRVVLPFSYDEAYKLLRAKPRSRWRLAVPEEDHNTMPGEVFLERDWEVGDDD